MFNRFSKLLICAFACTLFTVPQLIDSSANASSDAVRTGIDEGSTPAESDYDFVPLSSGRRLTGGGKAGYLKACGRVQFGSPCFPKDNAHMVTEEFSDFMMQQMPKCVSEGLKAQGHSANFKKLVIIGDTYANREIRGGSRMSMHSTGRGIDLWDLNIVLENGQKYDVNMTRASFKSSKYSKFYKTFVACWQNANKSRCSGKSGLTRRSGALDCTFNSAHHNHVHLSMPFCPRKSGIASN